MSGQLLPVRSEGQLVLSGEPATTRPQSIWGGTRSSAVYRDHPGRVCGGAGDGPVRVWLCVEDPALRSWRWEWLCAPVDSSRWDFLSLDQRALYSLYLPSLTDRPYPPIGRHDLRALVVVANPADPSGAIGWRRSIVRNLSRSKGNFRRSHCHVIWWGEWRVRWHRRR